MQLILIKGNFKLRKRIIRFKFLRKICTELVQNINQQFINRITQTQDIKGKFHSCLREANIKQALQWFLWESFCATHLKLEAGVRTMKLTGIWLFLLVRMQHMNGQTLRMIETLTMKQNENGSFIICWLSQTSIDVQMTLLPLSSALILVNE